MAEAMSVWGTGYMEKTLYLLPDFAVNLKLLFKKVLITIKW